MQIVLIPGLMNDGWVWRHQIGALSRIAPVSIACNDHSTSLTDMAARIVDGSTGPIAVAGHSMGGRIALEVWRRAPERIAGLALLDTGVHGPRDAEVPGRRRLVELARDEGMAAVAADWMPQMLAASRRGDQALIDGITAMIARCTPDIFAAQQEAMIGRADLAPLLPRIGCPTLVSTGEEDGWSPPEQHVAIAEAIPGATLRIVAGGGHMLPVEMPEAVTDILVEWAARVKAA
ncbi:MAG: alpha/beta hydrolase fold protein [Sphingomonas bacterium]|nr:alpha/beta hydrolase fold protein [Sphingomonas bacterium]